MKAAKFNDNSNNNNNNNKNNNNNECQNAARACLC